ncbi:MAG: hypothetical protein K0R47_225 [Brevibacillus sp.]|nr:hypothetical protein [Brevibacillus sp.]
MRCVGEKVRFFERGYVGSNYLRKGSYLNEKCVLLTCADMLHNNPIPHDAAHSGFDV